MFLFKPLNGIISRLQLLEVTFYAPLSSFRSSCILHPVTYVSRFDVSYPVIDNAYSTELYFFNDVSIAFKTRVFKLL